MATDKHLKPWRSLVGKLLGKLVYVIASGLGRLFVGGFVFFVLFWFGAVLFGQHFEAKSISPQAAKPTNQTIAELASNLFVTDEVRLERRFGNNLRLYVSKDSFEKIYYPDRQRAIKDFAVFWCDHVDKTYVPSVYLVDIHTGKRLTSYSCLWRIQHHSNKPTPSTTRPPSPQEDPSLWHPSPKQ